MSGPECEVCLEEFDLVARRPKLLSCGHTLCLECVTALRGVHAAGLNVIRCPKDRDETTSLPAALKDNFSLLSVIEERSSETKKKEVQPSRYWCTECSALATEICKEKHIICRLQRERGKQIKDTLDLLERAVKRQNRLIKQMKDAALAINNEIDEASSLATKVDRTLSQLHDGLELVGPEWERILQEAEDTRKICEERMPRVEEGLKFLESGSKGLEVTVSCAEGAEWRAASNLDAGQESSLLLLPFFLRTGMAEKAKEKVRTDTVQNHHDGVEGPKGWERIRAEYPHAIPTVLPAYPGYPTSGSRHTGPVYNWPNPYEQFTGQYRGSTAR